MKKSASKLRQEISKLEQQLRIAETREAERIGRLALKSGLGDIEVDEDALLEAFKEVSARFHRIEGREGSSEVASMASQRKAGEA